MNKDIKLGIAVKKLEDSYKYDDIIIFLKGKKKDCMYFDTLKPLYDEFGYEAVNEVLLEINKDNEVKEDE